MPEKNMKQGQFCWNELVTPDVGKAKEFYGNLFGWECHDVDMGEQTYTMIKNGDEDIGGIMQMPECGDKDKPQCWMSYILVDDIAAMVKKAESLGAEILRPVTQAGEFGQLAVIKDTGGAFLAFWQQA